MELTAEWIERAKGRGACGEAIAKLRPGRDVSRLPQSYFLWADKMELLTKAEIAAVLPAEVRGVPRLFALGSSGDGDGYGYGDGSGYGYGDGSGYGYGDGSGYGYGDGSG